MINAPFSPHSKGKPSPRPLLQARAFFLLGSMLGSAVCRIGVDIQYGAWFGRISKFYHFCTYQGFCPLIDQPLPLLLKYEYGTVLAAGNYLAG